MKKLIFILMLAFFGINSFKIFSIAPNRNKETRGENKVKLSKLKLSEKNFLAVFSLFKKLMILNFFRLIGVKINSFPFVFLYIVLCRFFV